MNWQYNHKKQNKIYDVLYVMGFSVSFIKQLLNAVMVW